jgi:hypothetical protein
MPRFAQAILPGGYRAKGVWHREASLRELTGEDEMYLALEGEDLLPAQWTTEVLARCVVSLGGLAPVTREAIRSLTVGDREALLLQLRRLGEGELLSCVLRCPDPDCAERMALDLKVSELLMPAYPDADEDYETPVRDADGPFRVRFRLPTGADQESAAILAHTDLEAAEELLLRRCVEAVRNADGEMVTDIPTAVREELSTRMGELDSQAEMTLQLACPECGGSFTALFDVASYVSEEIKAKARHLEHEIHLLAYHYHWGLAEILGLSAARRRRYLEILATELAEPGVQ